MSRYVAQCQGLGFVCDWEAVTDSRDATVLALVEHVNGAHGTGTTSPMLSALIHDHVTELPNPSHRQEPTT